METLLESALIEEVKESPGKTNQEIRQRLHQKNFSASKQEINKTLHTLQKREVLCFETKGLNKCWYLVPDKKPSTTITTETTTTVTTVMTEEAYNKILEKVRAKAQVWKSRNVNNILPTRQEKIDNFIENSLWKGLSSELRSRLTGDLFLYGWD